MLTDHPSQIRAALRSGSVIEIGAPSRREEFAPPSRWQIVLGFAAIYLIWGSTYLGIRYAVESIPPLLMMGIRHFTAGLLVFVWTRRRGDTAPTRLQWGYATVTGALLFLALPCHCGRCCWHREPKESWERKFGQDCCWDLAESLCSLDPMPSLAEGAWTWWLQARALQVRSCGRRERFIANE
ncbi:MAG: hypothetical protein DMG86_11360 [Acidobacteria bacterium]|nr:MAG: hypothetical protein DMG86_11360 [Acidobacteriota bacterium]